MSHVLKGLSLHGPILMYDKNTREMSKHQRESVLTTFPKGLYQTAIWGQEGLIPIITDHNFRHFNKCIELNVYQSGQLVHSR